MSLHPTRQMPVVLRTQSKTDVRTQFSALCYRFSKDKPEILLVTSRRSGRWILPKGWPIDGQTPGEAALTEAWEEAGVIGKSSEQCIGLYAYAKSADPVGSLPCLGLVFPVKVKSLAKEFPEKGQRRRQWFRPKKAASRVSEPELAQILRHFDPKRLLR